MELDIVRDLVRESPLKIWGHVEVELADYTPPPVPPKPKGPRPQRNYSSAKQIQPSAFKTGASTSFRKSSVFRGDLRRSAAAGKLMASCPPKQSGLMTARQLVTIAEDGTDEQLPHYMRSTASSRSRRVGVRHNSSAFESSQLNSTAIHTSGRQQSNSLKSRKFIHIRKALDDKFISTTETAKELEDNPMGEKKEEFEDIPATKTHETAKELEDNPMLEKKVELKDIPATKTHETAKELEDNPMVEKNVELKDIPATKTHETAKELEDNPMVEKKVELEDVPATKTPPSQVALDLLDLDLVAEVNENMPPVASPESLVEFALPSTANAKIKKNSSENVKDLSPTEFFTPAGKFGGYRSIDPKETPVAALCTNLRKLNLDDCI